MRSTSASRCLSPPETQLSQVCNPHGDLNGRGWPVARAEAALVTDEARLLNRELSWLDYNARVLALAAAGVIVGDVEDCTKKELEELELRFERDIFPILTPLAVGPGQPFPYISPLSLSLGIFVRESETGEERFARVKVPELLPRFLAVGERGLFIPLERVIRHFLPRLFP